MISFPSSLHDPRVCRVFISSPFNGLLEERDILAKNYWPRLKSYCESKGVHFCTVDLRWGISHNAAADAQIFNICLNEVNRSDIFIGFFGQRYGWHGIEDQILQMNFDNVKDKFPWIDKYRDRSVTEIEFLHGALNDSQRKPSCLCFRSAAYDRKCHEQYKTEGNMKVASYYVAESEVAERRLDDLKDRCAKLSTSLGKVISQKMKVFIRKQV